MYLYVIRKLTENGSQFYTTEKGSSFDTKTYYIPLFLTFIVYQ